MYCLILPHKTYLRSIVFKRVKHRRPALNIMATAFTGKKTACVTGATGYLASFLVKLLLEKGYVVHATTRDPDNKRKISHLLELQASNDLKIFQANLSEEGSFDTAIATCDIVFHVATPKLFYSEDPENEVIKPAVEGTVDILKACVKAKTVKRVVLTSSAAAVSIDKTNGSKLVMNEDCWTDIDDLTCKKPRFWGYNVSKTLAEKEAWKFAEENNIDLVSVIPPVIAGPSLTPDLPSSINFTMALLTGDELLINSLKNIIQESGSISFVHLEDVCRAHIYLAEKESASGRYICSAISTRFDDLSRFLNKRYPRYNVPTTDSEDFPKTEKSILSSEKLIKEGFSFKYGLEEIYDHSIEYFKKKGLLQK